MPSIIQNSTSYIQLNSLCGGEQPYMTLMTRQRGVKNCKQISDKMSLPATKNEQISPVSLQQQLRVARNEINNLR